MVGIDGDIAVVIGGLAVFEELPCIVTRFPIGAGGGILFKPVGDDIEWKVQQDDFSTVAHDGAVRRRGRESTSRGDDKAVVLRDA